MRADLHIHTHYSDGACSPDRIAAMAKSAGLTLISMTDHDSLAGYEEKAAAAEKYGLSYVQGWEISAYSGSKKVHVLGYGCRVCASYEAFLQARREGALARTKDVLNKANDYFGVNVTLADVERFHIKKDTPVHAMHVVAAYCERLCRTKEELYDTAFAPGGACHSLIGRPTPQDAIDVIHQTGGVAVLAHPGRLAMEQEERLVFLRRMVTQGLDGIECIHSDHTEQQTEQFAALAQAYGLLETGGSDFHAEGRGRDVGLPSFTPSESLLAALRRTVGANEKDG